MSKFEPKPHPHAEMIIEWARTGREVYEQLFSVMDGTHFWVLVERPTWHSNVKYSFNPDGDGK